ncbi:MAG: glycosyltransferase family 2 protein [Candidatus Omnitrophica bacterium]|nr:glycosyltransferase family 2 protein [Candidatus Omnitrophota bacterium]MCM8802485.1 glycosyltransferase family 2 protein [Candidatus Omnitrophota bacterium]
MWRNKKVSVIFPTYNEKDSIRNAIEDFFNSGYVDEIIVVNNNAVEGTDEEVKKTKARLVYERKQGYGYAIQKGLAEATGDYLIISEPDGTFEGKDVIKLLAYSDDFDYVLGTRTTRELIWKGANMNFFLKWGNWAVAKMMEFLYNTTTLTDVGCTMRLIKRYLYEKIKNHFTIGKEHFGPEMTILVIKTGTKFIEIPVNYKPRVGKSSVTGSMRKAFFLGLRMIFLILRYRFKRIKFK